MQDLSGLKTASPREERLMSHALVEIKRYLWWPFGVQTAVLLDISESGFKIEFTGKFHCKPEERFWMKIPLAPFAIAAPQVVTVAIIVKWFDPAKMRIGGVFESLDQASHLFLSKIIERVKEQAL